MIQVIEYSLRQATPEDLKLSYNIRNNALRSYVEQTWGWDEEWQWKYHVEDFNPAIMQIIECDGSAAGILELTEDTDFFVVSGIYIIDTYQSNNIGGNIM